MGMGFPSSFSNDIVQIQYNSMGGTLQNGREGKALHVMHITLPNNVQIQINRWNEPNEGSYVNVKIMMPKQPGQDGHCGNFNGNRWTMTGCRLGRAWVQRELPQAN